MTPLRLALVTRRFWPLVGGAEMTISNLAAELSRQGHRVQVVTAQWHPELPTRQTIHRDVQVVRLPNPAVRGWGTFRYMTALGRWLRKNQHEIDVVYVSMLKHSAVVATTRLVDSQIPVVLRAEGPGQTGDCHFHEIANFGMRIRRICQGADGFVAPSHQVREEMIQAGFAESKIHFIPNGVRIPVQVTPEQRRMARVALATANPVLTVAPTTPLVVFTGRLHAVKGLSRLVRAWPLVLQRFPAARLWLVGEGPQEAELLGLISALGLQSRIVIPGSFDTVEDVLAAADLFVLPSEHEGMSISLMEALAAGLPCVASDIPGNRILIQPGENGRLYPLEDPVKLAEAVIDLLWNRETSQRLAEAARQRVREHFSVEQIVAEHLQLFQSLIELKQFQKKS